MHDNPRPTEEEQELAQTERLEEEEDMRGGQSPGDQAQDEE
ncbi:MAG TPA: hypothetical protein VE088_04345 [Gaiellaceae bacterium]|jgi:hypothetical protein|nr:hypothetical protein [Gaiellaceae bacterium]